MGLQEVRNLTWQPTLAMSVFLGGRKQLSALSSEPQYALSQGRTLILGEAAAVCEGRM